MIENVSLFTLTLCKFLLWINYLLDSSFQYWRWLTIVARSAARPVLRSVVPSVVQWVVQSRWLCKTKFGNHIFMTLFIWLFKFIAFSQFSFCIWIMLCIFWMTNVFVVKSIWAWRLWPSLKHFKLIELFSRKSALSNSFIILLFLLNYYHYSYYYCHIYCHYQIMRYYHFVADFYAAFFVMNFFRRS